MIKMWRMCRLWMMPLAFSFKLSKSTCLSTCLSHSVCTSVSFRWRPLRSTTCRRSPGIRGVNKMTRRTDKTACPLVLGFDDFPVGLFSDCSDLPMPRQSSLTAHWSESLVIAHFYWLVACWGPLLLAHGLSTFISVGLWSCWGPLLLAYGGVEVHYYWLME